MPTNNVAARAAPMLRCVGGGLDSLDLFWRVPLSAGEIKRLQELKLEAIEAGRKGRRPTVLYGQGEEAELLEVQPNSARAGPILLDNEHMSVVLEPEPLKGMPSAMVNLKAFFLWQAGADRAVAAAAAVIYELAVDQATDDQLDPLVTGLDLCVDVQGWRPTLAQLTPRRHAADAEIVNDRLYTRAVGFNFRIEKRFESAEYGTKSSGISAMIYNKTLELEVSGKTWFEEVWKQSGRYVSSRITPDGEEVKEDVIRLEFRIKRKGLTEFMKAGAIENFSRWEDVRKHLDGLWTYLSKFWLVMRGKRSKKDRLANPVDPFWQQFVDAGEQLLQKGTAQVLRRKLHKVAERGTAAAAGYLVQLHACEQWELRDHRRTFEHNVANIVAGVVKYMRDKGWDPDLRVKEKYHREWIAMEHNGFWGEDLGAEEAA